MRKFILSFIIVLFYFYSSSAQFYKSIIPSPEFTKTLEKIVLDFRFNYKNIKGNSMMQEGGTETFESSIKLPGSQDCSITYYSSKVDTSASWQAILYKGKDYKEAVRIYQNIFRLVKKSHLNWIDRTLMRFTGNFENPKAEIGFATSILQLDVGDVRYKKFAAEIELLSNSYDNFEVHLNLQNRKNDDEQF